MRRLPAAPGARLFAPRRRGRPGHPSVSVTMGDRNWSHPPVAATRPLTSRGRRRATAIRVEGGHALTPALTLTKPSTGRSVTLVGTMHIGEGAYFHQLSGVVKRLAATGAEIHVEGISHRRRERLTDWERGRLAEADGWVDPEVTGAAMIFRRVETQGEGLRLPETARNIDLSHAELLRRIGWRNYRRLFLAPRAPRAPQAPEGPGLSPVPGPLVRAAVRFQLRHARALEALKSLRPRTRRVNRVVIRERNQLAFAGAIEALTRGDVGLVWGADHLPGLARLFHQAGYRLQLETRFAVCAV